MRKAKPKMQVELIGPIADVFIAKFQHLEAQNEKLIKSDEQNKIIRDNMLEEIGSITNKVGNQNQAYPK